MTTTQANGQYCKSTRLSTTGRLCKSLGMMQHFKNHPCFTSIIHTLKNYSETDGAGYFHCSINIS